MQPLDKTTELLIYAVVTAIAIVAALALIRVIQLFFIDTRPESPAYQRFQRVNGILFGAINTMAGIVATCGLAWWSWKAFQSDDNKAGRIGAYTAGLCFTCMLFCGVYPLWRSLRRRS